MRKYFILYAVCMCFNAGALTLFEHPDTARKNSLLLNMSVFRYTIGGEFEIPRIEVKADYMLPVPFPFSAGFFARIPDMETPNLKSFGLRIGCHLDAGPERLDPYAFYNFDFGWMQNEKLRKYRDGEQEIRFYDFRIGVRFIFGAFAGFYVETGYKFLSFDTGITIKIN